MDRAAFEDDDEDIGDDEHRPDGRYEEHCVSKRWADSKDSEI